MSLYLDQKYLMLFSNRLPLFKKKKDFTFNCRCIVCGDSQKNRRKARGYFFAYKTDLRYKCYNCDVSLSFANFLKQFDSNLYSQYSFEKYSEGSLKLSNAIPEVKFEEPKFKSKQENILDKLLVRLDKLNEDNEAVKFCKQRKIPSSKFKEIYYIENIKNIVQLNDKYKESIKGEEPRLILPFYDNFGQLSGVTCRALRGEALRYITVKIKEDTPLIFGIGNIDKTQTVFITEGPLDSLFLENCVAVSGTSFDKVNTLNIEKNKLVMIFDNQPRNKEVCKIIEKNIDLGYNVVIWPQTVQEKDINDMVLSGKNITQLVSKNVYSGLTAKAKFMAWKRC